MLATNVEYYRALKGFTYSKRLICSGNMLAIETEKNIKNEVFCFYLDTREFICIMSLGDVKELCKESFIEVVK